jgi:hypothetical protein
MMFLPKSDSLNDVWFWDTPTPIDFRESLFPELGGSDGSCDMSWHTTLLSEVTGIKFFCFLALDSPQLLGVHMHTRNFPSAEPTYDRILDSQELSEQMLWVYVPLPRSDPLAILGHAVAEQKREPICLRTYLYVSNPSDINGIDHFPARSNQADLKLSRRSAQRQESRP